jgi:hypothetical protein
MINTQHAIRPGPPRRGYEQVEYQRVKEEVIELMGLEVPDKEIAARIGLARGSFYSLKSRILHECLSENIAQTVAAREFMRLNRQASQIIEYLNTEAAANLPPNEKLINAYVNVSRRIADLMGANAPTMITVENVDSERSVQLHQQQVEMASKLTAFYELQDRMALTVGGAAIGSGLTEEERQRELANATAIINPSRQRELDDGYSNGTIIDGEVVDGAEGDNGDGVGADGHDNHAPTFPSGGGRQVFGADGYALTQPVNDDVDPSSLSVFSDTIDDGGWEAGADEMIDLDGGSDDNVEISGDVDKIRYLRRGEARSLIREVAGHTGDQETPGRWVDGKFVSWWHEAVRYDVEDDPQFDITQLDAAMDEEMMRNWAIDHPHVDSDDDGDGDGDDGDDGDGDDNPDENG